jgi:hypothetical protein
MVSQYQADRRHPASSFISFRTGSRPLLDRASLRSDNIHSKVPRVEATLRAGEKLSDDRLGEPPAASRLRG